MAEISVIVPVYKVEKYIHRCVDSILNQTYRDFELILVDDGSPDNCGAICDEYAQKDGRVVVIHQENGGLSAARNAGIDWAFANSDSEWITFVDSDDWVHPEYLNILYNAAVANDTQISVCRFLETSQTELKFASIEYYQCDILPPEAFFCVRQTGFNSIIAWAKLYDKQLFSSVRYPIGKIHEDLFTTHKALFSVDRIATLDAVMYYYYQSPGSIMRSIWNPRRLDEIEGYKLLIQVLKENKLEKAEEKAIQSYYVVLRNQCQLLLQIKQPEYNHYLQKLRSKLQYIMIVQRRLLHLNFNEDKWAYEIAFPRIMYLYWLGIAVIKKLRNWVKTNANSQYYCPCL